MADLPAAGGRTAPRRGPHPASGPATGRLARLRRTFPRADLVVFGHSHIPLEQAAADLRIFNPGSPTDRRRQPHGTLGLLRIESGVLAEAAIIAVT